MKERRREILRLIKQKDLEGAACKCKEYIDRDSDCAKVYIYLGYCYSELGRPNEALGEYRTAETCTDAEEVGTEVLQGMAKVFAEQQSYFEKPTSDQKYEEGIIIKVIHTYHAQDKQEQYAKYVHYLISIYEYTDTQKYIEAICKYLHIATDSPNLPATESLDTEALPKLPITEEEQRRLITGYIRQRLREFHSKFKTLVESGAFSRAYSTVRENLSLIYKEHEEMEKYIAFLGEIDKKAGTRLFLSQLHHLYLPYLGTKVYSTPLALDAFVTVLVECVESKLNLENHLPLIKLIVSDYLDFSGTLGTLSEYKSLLYNTLSPTMVLLRFAERSSHCHAIYKDIEAEVGPAYPLKRQHFTAAIYKNQVNQKLGKDMVYTGTEEFQEMERLYTPITHPTPLKHIITDALSYTNFYFLETALKQAKAAFPSLNTMHVSRSSGTSPCLSAQERLLEAATGLFSLDILRYTAHIDALYIEMVTAHVHVFNGHTNKAYGILEDTHSLMDKARQDARDRSHLPLYAETFAAVDALYGYGKFLAEYITRIAETQGQSAPQTPGKRPSLVVCAYSSEYGRHQLSQKYTEGLKPLSILKCPVNRFSPFFTHMVAFANYEKGNTSLGISMLQGLYEDRENDYHLVSDLAFCLSEQQQEPQALAILDGYLRGRVYREETHLFALSLQLLREAQEWQRVEMRCKDLLCKEKTYKVEMALAESLANQKKFAYALKVVTEIIKREETKPALTSERLLSAHLFTIYLQIKTEDLENLDQQIDQILPKATDNPNIYQTLLRYKKYICAKQIKTAIASEGLSTAVALLQKYRNTPSTPTDSSPLSCAISITDGYAAFLSHALERQNVSGPKLTTEMPATLPDPEKQQLLNTSAKLALLHASIEGTLTNPHLHQRVAKYLKHSRAFGESKGALEAELIVRAAREEDVSRFYEGDRVSEETASARLFLSLLYRPNDLAPSAREYLKHSTLADAPLLQRVAQALAASTTTHAEDLEVVFLHLCRRHSPEDKEIAWIYNELQK
ncbi:hypothetical protein NEDG_00591 [Nematocida displodere]|uniref:Tetratricopeptide repeat protein n=1 Tax=Nematocida displodere TaxID=1805483 RepID=A0A177ECA8_9MICR|nr:hypothetical protein NEDG_00591 [Nematocida displodere]